MIKVVEKKYTIGEYSMFKDEDKNRVIFQFDGFLPEYGFSDFLDEYANIKKSVKLSETTLVLEASKLRVFPNELEEQLGKLYRDYIDFKKIYVVTPESIVSRKQIERVFRANNIFPYYEFINGLNEI